MMRKNAPTRERGSGRLRPREWSFRRRSDEIETAPLEDDGLIYWPSSLGSRPGPNLVRVGPGSPKRGSTKPKRQRLATSVVLTVLFFAGAALTATAGNEVAGLVAGDTPQTETAAQSETSPVTTSDTTTTESLPTETETSGAPAEEPASDTVAAGTETDPATTTEAGTVADPPSESPTATGSNDPAPAEPSPPPGDASNSTTEASDQPLPPASSSPTTDVATTTSEATAPVPEEKPTPAPAADQEDAQPVLALPTDEPAAKGKNGKASKSRARTKSARSRLNAVPKPHEIEPEQTRGVTPGAVLWLSQPLPDPTPPSLRLSPAFARELRAASTARGLDWAFLLAVLRAERVSEPSQISLRALRSEALELGPLHASVNDRKAALAYRDDRLFARRVVVLARYYRAIGMKALVRGLVASRDELAAKLLSDPRVSIYAGGRDDITAGRVDVRILALISYMAESFGEVQVSSLVSGHRLYARPGVVSAHVFGRGLDIAALDEIPIYGHQEQGSVTELAVRQILLLPAELRPRQVISLLGLGGPSFALANHADHIHVGY